MIVDNWSSSSKKTHSYHFVKTASGIKYGADERPAHCPLHCIPGHNGLTCTVSGFYHVKAPTAEDDGPCVLLIRGRGARSGDEEKMQKANEGGRRETAR